MPTRRLNTDAVTDAALDLADRDGFGALTISSVAEQLDVGPSALYSHVDGLDDLHYLVAVAATSNLTDGVRDAAIGARGLDALRSMGDAYRTFALDHAGQFASTLLPPRGDDDDLAEANRRLTDVFVLVYGASGLTGEQSMLAARSTRSAIHGFLALEHTLGSTDAHDAEYAHLIATLSRGLLPSP